MNVRDALKHLTHEQLVDICERVMVELENAELTSAALADHITEHEPVEEPLEFARWLRQAELGTFAAGMVILAWWISRR